MSTEIAITQKELFMEIANGNGIDQVRQWLEGRNKQKITISNDLDLIDVRLVDSLSFVEFIYTINEASGKEVDLESIELENLRTLGAIERFYF